MRRIESSIHEQVSFQDVQHALQHYHQSVGSITFSDGEKRNRSTALMPGLKKTNKLVGDSSFPQGWTGLLACGAFSEYWGR